MTESYIDLSRLEKALHYKFANYHQVLEALTHKSHKQPYNNERLEFLGDAVMGLIVGEYLFAKFPDKNEGDLSKLRACLVNEKSFSKLAISIDLGDFLLMSKSEASNHGRKKASILANAFEALIGAIYLESSLENVRKIALNLLDKNYENIDLDSLFTDYKTTLQEITQARFNNKPEYIVVSEMGPDHNKTFEISVKINNIEYARCIGSSKKIAQQNGAKIAIAKLQEQM